MVLTVRFANVLQRTGHAVSTILSAISDFHLSVRVRHLETTICAKHVLLLTVIIIFPYCIFYGSAI